MIPSFYKQQKGDTDAVSPEKQHSKTLDNYMDKRYNITYKICNHEFLMYRPGYFISSKVTVGAVAFLLSFYKVLARIISYKL